MPQIPFVGPSYKARSTNLDAQVCINLFPVIGESGAAKVVRALYGTPGRRLLASAANRSPIRGVHAPTNGGQAVVVAGSSVYRMDAAFTLTEIGTIDGLDNMVHIRDNGAQAVIVTGSRGYIVDLVTNQVSQIADEAFYGAGTVEFLSTFGIFNKPGTNMFYITASGEITFDALDFASAESNSEPIITFAVDHSDLVIFKKSVAEVWRVSGGVDFPLSKDTNAAIEHGCAAARSVAKLDNTLFWLGSNAQGDGIVWRLNGYTPQRVSTDAIEFAIASYPTIADAVAFSYQQEGHSFYVISFPTGDATWVYDVATQLWHQRAYLDPATGVLGRDRSNCHMYFGGEHVAGDCRTGDLYALDLDYYMDGTDPMPAIRAAAYIHNSTTLGRIAHSRVQVDLESGVGTVSGQGKDPVALLDWSDDNGKTWSNQYPARMGATGEYHDRLIWTRLGNSRARVYRLTISDPVKRVILGAIINP